MFKAKLKQAALGGVQWGKLEAGQSAGLVAESCRRLVMQPGRPEAERLASL
jgi:hypothetical protein